VTCKKKVYVQEEPLGGNGGHSNQNTEATGKNGIIHISISLEIKGQQLTCMGMQASRKGVSWYVHKIEINNQ